MDYKITNNLNSNVYQDALKIRREVFIDEQKVPEDIEIDELEALCWHIVIYKNDKPVATARLFPKGDICKVQRVAVIKDFRSKGVGREVMQIAMQKAILLGAKFIELDAQKHALNFYRLLGYEVISDEFIDAGIPHYSMRRKIT